MTTEPTQTRFRRLVALPPEERRLLLEAAAAVLTTRAALRLLPYRVVVRATGWRRARQKDSTDPRQAAWAVDVASRALLGRNTCLTRALATQTLLHWHGIPARLELGVAKRDPDGIDAHAWVECNGEIVMGAVPDHDRYHTLR